MTPTNWTGRTPVNTTWGKIRLGGAYLQDYLGNYILTNSGDRIIVIVPGGDLSITNWSSRPGVSTSWSGRPII